MSKTALFLFGLLAFSAHTVVADSLWQDVDYVARNADSSFAHRQVRATEPALRSALSDAPMEFSKGTEKQIFLPMPDGNNQLFRVEESPILAPELAAQYPEIKTYRVFGIDDPSASGRIGITGGAFHGLLHTGNGTVWIDSSSSADTYRSYYKRDYTTAHRGNAPAFSCGVQSDPAAEVSPVEEFRYLARTEGARRVYRIAVAATGEYTAAVGGGNSTTAFSGPSGVVAAMNRVNQIYNRDLNVQLNLVSSAAQVYADPNTDPFTGNNNAGTLINEIGTVLDNALGNSAYDIGHAFSTGAGGLAGLGVVCGANKARGVTGLTNPVGDPFFIDFVAHEIGHQFSGNHTFNGTTGNCVGGNRNPSTAYEPGSGSTIMAYAGICGAENIQSNSDATFHAGSIIEMNAFIATATCNATVASSNTAPTVNAGTDFTIPGSTPFTLTGTASDTGSTTLIYQWDELDAGGVGGATTAGTLGTDFGSNPLFRSYAPTCDASRTFPSPAILRANSNPLTSGETLPTTNRTLNFRFTARDLEGGVNEDDMQVTVNAASGPFAVTSPNTATLVDATVGQTITWNVASTNNAPVSCATVDIHLSIDGGHTFPTLLRSAIPNDGSEAVNYPQTATRNARVRVKCSNNIFFDISDVDFGLATAANPGPLNTLPTVSPPTPSACTVVTAGNSGVPTTPAPAPSGGGGGSAANPLWLLSLFGLSALAFNRRRTGQSTNTKT